ncbi:MAG TPA: hypothetical protein VKZ85_07730, partial [Woeseiaceae bacterium]|nr:hypothetical protein [Woeseiaceae bacterium]
QSITGTGIYSITGTGVDSITGTGSNSITGTGAESITGTGSRSITGTGINSITGTGAQSITGTGIYSITGTGVDSITGTGSNSITGTGADSITGTGSRSITGTGIHSITGTGAQSITGTGADLLVLGPVEHVADGFISVLGQTVFGVGGQNVGDVVAVFGSIDHETGGIVNARVVPARSELSYLRGIVDAVDRSTGRAVVSGVTVDYTALLANGRMPAIGDEVAVSGRAYSGLGLLVAQ